MDQKSFANVVLMILLAILAVVVGNFALRKSPAQPTNQTPPSAFTGDTFSINLSGYFKTCLDAPVMYKRANGSWKKANTELPGKGLYYLDDKFVGYGMCDAVACAELPKPYTMQLVEYKKEGEKTPPSDSGSTANTLPVYQTVPLSGDIKIDIQYFSESFCFNQFHSFASLFFTFNPATRCAPVVTRSVRRAIYLCV